LNICGGPDFYDAALDANMTETTRLAHTIQTWWPAILVALTEQVTNAALRT
jgi:transposase